MGLWRKSSFEYIYGPTASPTKHVRHNKTFWEKKKLNNEKQSTSFGTREMSNPQKVASRISWRLKSNCPAAESRDSWVNWTETIWGLQTLRIVYTQPSKCATSRSSNVVLKKPKTNKRRNIISHSSSVSQGINKRRDYTIVIIVIREFVFVCQRSTRRATSYLKLVGGKCYSKRDHTRPSDRVPYSKGIIRRIYWFKFMM